jgi:hypothetical protein
VLTTFDLEPLLRGCYKSRSEGSISFQVLLCWGFSMEHALLCA